MLAKVRSFSLNGLDGFEVSVEVDVNAGLPAYEIVGMGDTAVKESRERVRAAIKNSLLDYPIRKIVVNLAPADSRKEEVFTTCRSPSEFSPRANRYRKVRIRTSS